MISHCGIVPVPGIVRKFSPGYDDIWVICTRCLYSIAFFAVAVHAQTSSTPDLTKLIQSFNTAVRDDNLTLAAEIAAKLDAAVQKRYHRWLVRDAQERVDEALTWLPVETEAITVHQRPFTVSDELAEFKTDEHPSQDSMVERLAKLNAGAFYKALRGRTIRLVVAGAANMRSRGRPGSFIDPPLSPDADSAWFYFFTEPLSIEIFGSPDFSARNTPVWRGTAELSVASTGRGERKASVREDESWLALARPDLLVMTTSRELLEKIANRIANGSKERALPGTLPEWQYVNRAAPVWGLRHYSSPGDAIDNTNPRSKQDILRFSDPAATGLVMQFDPDTQRIEMDYLSTTDHLPAMIDGLPLAQFRHERSAGLWRLTAEQKSRLILHAIGLLGFGGYR